MAATECGNGHIYDSQLYSSCPYCNSNQSMIDFTNTPVNNPNVTAPLGGGFNGGTNDIYNPPKQDPGTTYDIGVTMPIGGPLGGEVPSRRVDDEQKTEAISNITLGFDPVVGWLVCLEGKNPGADYKLYSKINTIGRSERMDVNIKGDNTISKENHARLAYSPKSNTFRLIPAENANNICINDEEVYTATIIKGYDILEIGQTKLLFLPLCSERFSWENGLTYTAEV